MEIPTLEDRLAAERAIGKVLFNVRNFPEKAQVRLLGQDMAPLNDKLTDAILAEGFRLTAPAAEMDAHTALRQGRDQRTGVLLHATAYRTREPEPSMKIQAGTKVKFEFDDGSTLDWKLTEPCTVEHLQDGIDKWARLNDTRHPDGIDNG